MALGVYGFGVRGLRLGFGCMGGSGVLGVLASRWSLGFRVKGFRVWGFGLRV